VRVETKEATREYGSWPWVYICRIMGEDAA
jgi:hypothetical protein